MKKILDGGRNGRWRPAAFISVIAAVLMLTSCGRETGATAAALQEDWRSVLRATKDDRHAAPGLLRANALLAVNRDDEAICAFQSTDDRARHDWDLWTKDLVRVNPKATSAHYLRGDALARVSDFVAAEREFTRALELQPENQMALSGRGVIRCLRGDWTGIDDLRRATEVKPGSAGSWNNLGYANLASGRSADSAADAFAEALHISPTFTLANAGKGYAALVLGQWQAGSTALRAARIPGTCTAPMVAGNLSQLTAWAESMAGSPGDRTDEPPGVEMSQDLHNLIDQHDLSAVGQIGHLLGSHPELNGAYQTAMDSLRNTDNAFYNRVLETTKTDATWTQPGGYADTLLNTLKSFSADLGLGAETKDKMSNLKFNAGISISPAPLLDRQLQQTTHDYSGYSQMLNDMKSSMPGGATTSLAAAHLDRGDWPLVPLYTLGYVIGGVK
jgi:Flp pilus assembly protein TadD